MPTSFMVGFTCCSMVMFLYLFHELVMVLKVLVVILQESLDELRDE